MNVMQFGGTHACHRTFLSGIFRFAFLLIMAGPILAEADTSYVVIEDSGANLREKPDKGSKKLDTLRLFDKVELLERTQIRETFYGKEGAWLKVKTSTDKVGYLLEHFVTEKSRFVIDSEAMTEAAKLPQVGKISDSKVKNINSLKTRIRLNLRNDPFYPQFPNLEKTILIQEQRGNLIKLAIPVYSFEDKSFVEAPALWQQTGNEWFSLYMPSVNGKHREELQILDLNNDGIFDFYVQGGCCGVESIDFYFGQKGGHFKKEEKSFYIEKASIKPCKISLTIDTSAAGEPTPKSYRYDCKTGKFVPGNL